ncbi:glycosyltransferase family 9 protein [Shewanella benthica]|uniref:Glycosyl transferase, family 9 n=1 Tax=Shewanella benthica KT99 TaxID=314608 RepID=A9CYF0_9GAMM|nr:glycosyltransferase family 9 protein [Shewanella benthica]EDQ02467.1 Glycosyl transferase, family 9 [Shewanella benthica KT99]
MSIISSTQLESAKRLLFISPVALGDFLYLKTFLIALKKQYPHIELDIWLDDNRFNTESWRLSRSKILQQWIETEGCFTRSYGCCSSEKQQRAQILDAQALNYDLIITHSGSKSEQFSNIAREIGPDAFIVSSIGKSKYFGLIDRFLFRNSDQLFKLKENDLPSKHHITDRYYQLLNRIAGIKLDKDDFMPSLTIPNQIAVITQNWLKTHFTDSNRQGQLIFLNHLSTNNKRDWQESQLFELIQLIGNKSPGSRFVVNVTKENYNKISDAIKNNIHLTNLQVSVFTINEHFFELPSMIASANLVITVETAIMHFATASNRPLIAMMRQKKPYWAPPSSQTSRVLYASKGKGYVSDICVKQVLDTYIDISQ